MSEHESQPNQEIREGTITALRTADKLINGTYEEVEFDENSHNPLEVLEGPILDYNDESVSEYEVKHVMAWITGKLGATPDEAPHLGQYQSPDGQTECVIYKKALGPTPDDAWHISKWQNEGQKPSFIFQPMYDFYDSILEMYEEVS